MVNLWLVPAILILQNLKQLIKNELLNRLNKKLMFHILYFIQNYNLQDLSIKKNTEMISKFKK